MAETDKRVPALVVDTAALLQLDLRLDQVGTTLYTIPEVLQEVRSRQARDALVQRPYDLQQRQPTDAALRFVSDFAKKTGDFPSLSAVDLRVLALTYMLEVELAHGAAHLRKEPLPPRTVVGSGGAPLDAAAEAARQPEGFYYPGDHPAADGHAAHGPTATDHATLDHTLGAQPGATGTSAVLSSPGTAAEPNDVTSAAPGNLHAAAEDARMLVEANQAHAHDDGGVGDNDDDDDDDDGDDDDDDDDGWITPSNVAAMRAKHRAAAGKPVDEAPPRPVACITADFAMQNVLMQIGLRVIGVDGKLIQQMRTYVLRCHACFKSTKDMTKKFCPTCGNATLLRTSVSVDADGTLRYHLKPNFQYRVRGTKYPLPMPQGGRASTNLVLSEDQKEFTQRQARTRKERRAENAFDPDASVGFANSTGRQSAPGPPVGYGRRNPNETKGRTGRKKS